ncbi:MAG: hypothetical protein K6T85_12495 [Gorillibacterium sp.]|nr:hypothetical protein [Gorillibacterium sp.]
MGVKFAREYEDIIAELTKALEQLEPCYTLLDMEEQDWLGLAPEEQQECLRTLADDVFYGLGTEAVMELGQDVLSYEPDKHIIKVAYSNGVTQIVRLI